jgi:hypothetical protein
MRIASHAPTGARAHRPAIRQNPRVARFPARAGSPSHVVAPGRLFRATSARADQANPPVRQSPPVAGSASLVQPAHLPAAERIEAFERDLRLAEQASLIDQERIRLADLEIEQVFAEEVEEASGLSLADRDLEIALNDSRVAHELEEALLASLDCNLPARPEAGDSDAELDEAIDQSLIQFAREKRLRAPLLVPGPNEQSNGRAEAQALEPESLYYPPGFEAEPEALEPAALYEAPVSESDESDEASACSEESAAGAESSEEAHGLELHPAASAAPAEPQAIEHPAQSSRQAVALKIAIGMALASLLAAIALWRPLRDRVVGAARAMGRQVAVAGNAIGRGAAAATRWLIQRVVALLNSIRAAMARLRG